MKLIKFLILSLVLTACSSRGLDVLYAGDVREEPYKTAGTAETVTIDNSTLTKIPTSQDAGRWGFYVAVSSANTGNIVGHVGNCSSASYANTVRPIQMIKGTSSNFFKFNENLCLWLITTHSAPETIGVQQVKQ